MESGKNKVTGISFEEADAQFKNKNSNSRFEYKDKSLLAKMGFQDGQLKTPEHDKMIDILMDDMVLSKIANKTMNIKNKDIEFNSNDEWTKNEEYIIKGHNGYIIGYVDLLSTIKKSVEYYEENGKCEYKKYYHDNPYYSCYTCLGDDRKICKVSDYSGKCDNESIIGSKCHKYDNIRICKFTNQGECSYYKNTVLTGHYNVSMFIEAKPVIESIGELVRQVNTYRECIRSTVNEYNYYSQHSHESDYFRNEYEKRRVYGSSSFQESSLYFIVVSANTSDNQRKRLYNANITLIDIKELI